MSFFCSSATLKTDWTEQAHSVPEIEKASSPSCFMPKMVLLMYSMTPHYNKWLQNPVKYACFCLLPLYLWRKSFRKDVDETAYRLYHANTIIWSNAKRARQQDDDYRWSGIMFQSSGFLSHLLSSVGLHTELSRKISGFNSACKPYFILQYRSWSRLTLHQWYYLHDCMNCTVPATTCGTRKDAASFWLDSKSSMQQGNQSCHGHADLYVTKLSHSLSFPIHRLPTQGLTMPTVVVSKW